MPIKKENKARYPKNWAQISKATRERDGQKCCFCAVDNHTFIDRLKSNNDECFYQYVGDYNRMFCADAGKLFYVSDFKTGLYKTSKRTVKIVLTVAHLDHAPENCVPENLKSLCQQCHNRYDAEHRKQSRKETKANAEENQQLLF